MMILKLLVFAIINLYNAKAQTCKLGKETLQICDGTPSYIRPKSQQSIKVTPDLEFIDLSDINHDEKTATIFVTLALIWNETKMFISKHG